MYMYDLCMYVTHHITLIHLMSPIILLPRRQVRRNGRGPGRGCEAAVRGRHDAARMAGRARVAQQVLCDEPRIFHARRGGVDEPWNDDLTGYKEVRWARNHKWAEMGMEKSAIETPDSI